MPGAPLVMTAGSTGAPTMYPATIVALPAASYTAGNTIVFDTTWVMHAALDITLTSFTGGTSPKVTFAVDRQGADGVWYNVWNSGAVGTATVWSIDICPSITQQTTGTPSAPDAAVHNVWTFTGRFSYTFTGAPTSVNFSASLIGR